MSTFTEEVLGVLARKADVVGFLMEQEADASMIEYEVIELCDLIRRARGDFYGPESEAAP